MELPKYIAATLFLTLTVNAFHNQSLLLTLPSSPGGGGVLWISSDRDGRGIFLGLQFSISGLFWAGKFWQELFWVT